MSEPVSIIIMNHGRFGEELIASAELIIGKIEGIQAVSLMPGMSIEDFYGKAEQAVTASEGNILVLTDLFGGTPCNVAMMMKQKYKLTVLCGVNLPMLIEAASLRDTVSQVDELAESVLGTAKDGVLQPSEAAEAEDDWGDA